MSAVKARAGAILSRLNGADSVVGAEIGVGAGLMSFELLRRPGMFLYMIDSWKAAEEQSQAYRDTGDFHAQLSAEQQWRYYLLSVLNTDFAAKRREIFKMDSVETSCRIPNGSLDFVFIDGDHSYEGCRRDIEAWSMKLKAGGLFGGHDYVNPAFPAFGVTQAVNEAVEERGWKLDRGENFTWFVRP